MKGQLLKHALQKPEAQGWVPFGNAAGYIQPGGGVLSHTSRHTHQVLISGQGAANRARFAHIHVSVSNHAAWPCFPWPLRLVRNTQGNMHHSLPWHPSLRACVHESVCGQQVYVCMTYLHLRLGNDSQPIINLSARLHDMSASRGSHFLSTPWAAAYI